MFALAFYVIAATIVVSTGTLFGLWVAKYQAADAPNFVNKLLAVVIAPALILALGVTVTGHYIRGSAADATEAWNNTLEDFGYFWASGK